jgi:hypothetical protein
MLGSSINGPFWPQPSNAQSSKLMLAKQSTLGNLALRGKVKLI